MCDSEMSGSQTLPPVVWNNWSSPPVAISYTNTISAVKSVGWMYIYAIFIM